MWYGGEAGRASSIIVFSPFFPYSFLSLCVCALGFAPSTLHVNTRGLGVSLIIFSLTSYAAGGVKTATTHHQQRTAVHNKQRANEMKHYDHKKKKNDNNKKK